LTAADYRRLIASDPVAHSYALTRDCARYVALYGTSVQRGHAHGGSMQGSGVIAHPTNSAAHVFHERAEAAGLVALAAVAKAVAAADALDSSVYPAFYAAVEAEAHRAGGRAVPATCVAHMPGSACTMLAFTRFFCCNVHLDGSWVLPTLESIRIFTAWQRRAEGVGEEAPRRGRNAAAAATGDAGEAKGAAPRRGRTAGATPFPSATEDEYFRSLSLERPPRPDSAREVFFAVPGLFLLLGTGSPFGVALHVMAQLAHCTVPLAPRWPSDRSGAAAADAALYGTGAALYVAYLGFCFVTHRELLRQDDETAVAGLAQLAETKAKVSKAFAAERAAAVAAAATAAGGGRGGGGRGAGEAAGGRRGRARAASEA